MMHRKTEWVVGRVLETQARARGDRPFLEFASGARFTYAEADAQANRLANGLAALGIRKGDAVAVMLPNGEDYVFVWLALSRLGAIHVAVNTGYAGRFLAHVLANAEAKVAIAHAEYLPRIDAIRAELPALRRILVAGSMDHVGSAGGAALGLAPIEAMRLEDAVSSNASLPDVDVSYRDVNTIMYTSGTTGPSKGVLMPHAHNYLLGLGILENLGVTEEDAYYICMPLFHANAMFMQLYATMIAGARAAIVPKFSASRWLEDVRKYGATVTHTIGVMTDFLLQQPEAPSDADTPLRLVLAVPTPPEIAPKFRKRFGVKMVEGFGMTECNMPLYMRPDDAPRDGSCGRPYARYFDVRIVDPETDEELEKGEVGEIVVRPREPFGFSLGYHRMPDKTADAVRNFWFHTGDAGRTDDDGYFYFVDRIKDCIRRRGENISSFEIESVLLAFPDVVEAAAVAVKSTTAGGEDEVKACVVAREGAALDPAALVSFCRGKMPDFAIPRYVEVMRALPRTPTEKIQKAMLRAAGVTDATWDRLA
jgi:crotonobetaine/carnitine-CoA ligase